MGRGAGPDPLLEQRDRIVVRFGLYGIPTFLLFRDGNSRTYVAHMQGPCNGLASGHYALVTKQFGGLTAVSDVRYAGDVAGLSGPHVE